MNTTDHPLPATKPITKMADFILFGWQDDPADWPAFGPDPHGFYWRPERLTRDRDNVRTGPWSSIKCPTREVKFVRCDWANIIDSELAAPAISEG